MLAEVVVVGCSLVRSEADVHLLATVLIPFDANSASIRPLVARDAAARARIDTLLFRYQEPGDAWIWGVDFAHGFRFDWWALGGRWNGWGREVRTLMTRQRLRPSQRPIPRFIERSAVWSEDLGRVRLITSLFPVTIVTPYGEWIECPAVLPNFGKSTVRVRKATASWRRKIRKLMSAYPGCLAVAVDYHC